jgi:hypothetical protein
VAYWRRSILNNMAHYRTRAAALACAQSGAPLETAQNLLACRPDARAKTPHEIELEEFLERLTRFHRRPTPPRAHDVRTQVHIPPLGSIALGFFYRIVPPR